MIIEKSKDKKKWATILFNLKLKNFNAKRVDRTKIYLLMNSGEKDLVLYFSDEKKTEMVEALILSNKKQILLKELGVFS